MDTNMSSRLEIYIGAKNLPNLDTFSKTDPMCVVYLRESAGAAFKEIGRTECIDNDLNPVFKKKFVIEYFFEEAQELKFDMYDIDGKSTDLTTHDYIGSYQCGLGALVSAPGQALNEKLKNRAGSLIPRAQINIRCEEVSETKDYINVTVVGEKLEKMDLFGKSDPYLEFYRQREDGSWVETHKTEVVMKTLNPRWKPFTITLQNICNGDSKRPVLIKCWDWDRNSSPDFIGQFETSVSEIKETKGGGPFVLTRPAHKDPKKRAKPRGTLSFPTFDIIKEYSFVDFLKGGMQLGMMVAIDFTGSNGNPEDPTSLHYRRGTEPNEYQQAISTIGQIVSQYDTDGKFPMWGFGGKVGGEVRHCFPLTFRESEPEVVGVDGLLAAYHNSFSHVLLSGPTYFQEIIRTAASVASQPYSAGVQHYSILLIITDGVINDMQQTISAIVDASDKPLSIIIVGVGAADFSNMEQLDGDTKALEFKGKKAARDIVQFVPFRNFRGQHISRLAKETLAEVPKQLVGFARQHRVTPMAARRAIERMPTVASGIGHVGAGAAPSPGYPGAGAGAGAPPPSYPPGYPGAGGAPPGEYKTPVLGAPMPHFVGAGAGAPPPPPSYPHHPHGAVGSCEPAPMASPPTYMVPPTAAPPMMMTPSMYVMGPGGAPMLVSMGPPPSADPHAYMMAPPPSAEPPPGYPASPTAAYGAPPSYPAGFGPPPSAPSPKEI